MKKLIVYIACSADGYIATKQDNLDFLNSVAAQDQDYGYAAFMDTVDAVILGRRTYDKVIELVGGPQNFPHLHKPCYILSRSRGQQQLKPALPGEPYFYSGDIAALVHMLRNQPGKGNIFLDGGAAAVNEFLHHDLIDEFIISIIPVLLGDGIRLFSPGGTTKALQLQSVQHFSSGLVQIHYHLSSKQIRW
jgi:dihydrofolate reductase